MDGGYLLLRHNQLNVDTTVGGGTYNITDKNLIKTLIDNEKPVIIDAYISSLESGTVLKSHVVGYMTMFQGDVSVNVKHYIIEATNFSYIIQVAHIYDDYSGFVIISGG